MSHDVRRPPRLVVGAKSVTRALGEGRVRRVLVADDAPATTTEPVRRLATQQGLLVLAVSSARELGLHCGVDRPVAAVAELDPLLRTAQVPVPGRR